MTPLEGTSKGMIVSIGKKELSDETSPLRRGNADGGLWMRQAQTYGRC